jgi:putative transposase
LQQAAELGLIRLLYLDETGFESWSPVTYSWSRVGTQKRQEQTACRRRISLLGLWEPQHCLSYGLSFGGVDSQTYLHLMNWQAQQAAKRFDQSGVVTVVVQDNAPIHTSRAVQAQIQTWQQQGLLLFHLPKYCSEMNLVETEWRQTKAHHICGEMFDDHYALALGVIAAVRARADDAGYGVERFDFNTHCMISSPLLST